MSKNSSSISIKIPILFKDFLEYLVKHGYSDSKENLLIGVFQRAFLDEYIYFLAKRKMEPNSIVNHIKDQLFR
jgi:hypothetical protein